MLSMTSLVSPTKHVFSDEFSASSPPQPKQHLKVESISSTSSPPIPATIPSTLLAPTVPPRHPTVLSKAQYIVARHSDVAQKMVNLCIYSTILLQKSFESIPNILGRSCQVYLSYTGIIYLPTQIRHFKKTCTDLTDSVHNSSKLGMTTIGAKAVNSCINIALTVSCFAISVVRLAGYLSIVEAYYKVAVPISLAGWATSAALELYRPIGKFRVTKITIEMAKESDKKIEQIWREIQGKSSEKASEFTRNITTDTWLALKHKMKEVLTVDEKRQILSEFIPYYQAAQTASLVGLTLRAWNYFALIVCKAYPDTAKEAAVRLMTCILWTSKLFYRKYTEFTTEDAIANPKVPKQIF